MQFPSTAKQVARHFLYDASGSITAGGTAQLVLPEHQSRLLLIFENTSDTNMYLEFGSARGTAVLTNGVVTSVSVTNGGFGFTYPPSIEFFGGGNDGWNVNNPTMLVPGQPGSMAPKNPASARAVLTGGVVTSVVIDDGGANYNQPPYVFFSNSINDPFGCASPSATVGIQILPGGSLSFNGVACPTDPMAVFCATTGKTFVCKFMV